ncbi:MAG: aminoglycoside phosphotransferase family protein [Caldilineaceae bacterium]
MVHSVSADLAATLFAQVYAGAEPILAVERIPRAYNYEVWRVDTITGHYTLKIAHADMEPARIVNVMAALRLATDAGVPCPRLLAYAPDTQIGRAVLVHEWIAGDDAETVWSHMSRDEQARFAFAFGRAIAAMHSVTGPSFSEDAALTRPMVSWHAGLYDYLNEHAVGMRQLHLLPLATLETLVDYLRQAITGLSPTIRPALTHWDLWLANTIVDAGRFVGVIDWDSAAFSDPVADFVRLEVWLFTPYPESRTPFWAGYSEMQSIDHDHEARLDVYQGLEYFAEVYRTTARNDLTLAAHFRERLKQWMIAHAISA